MLNLYQGQSLDLLSGRHGIIDIRGNWVYLRNESTGEPSRLHYGELPSQLAATPLADIASRTVPQLITGLSDEQTELLKFWEDHIREVLEGCFPGRDHCDLRYSPGRPKNARVDEKVAEITKYYPDKKISRATFFRKQDAYLKGDIAGVIGVNLSRPVDPFAQADPRLVEAITWVIADHARRSTVTEKELHRRVHQHLLHKYQDQAPVMPSDKTLYKYFDLLGGKTYATGSAANRKSAAGVRSGKLKSTAVLRPGSEIQLDETPMDIWVRLGEKIVRPRLLMAVDVATRTIAGWSIQPSAATAYDATLVLAQMLVPFQMRPDAHQQRRLVQAHNPSWRLAPPDLHREMHLRAAQVIPRRIMTDNGKSFTGGTFRAACSYFGIDVTYSAIHTPTDKPIVERTFQSINDLFLQDKPGYIGNAPNNRGYQIEKAKDLLTLPLLIELFDDWVVTVWQTRPHKGLKLPLDERRFTPNEWFALNSELAGGLPVPLTRDDFLNLLPVEHRTIQRTGVQLFDQQFDSTELDELRFQPSNLADADRKWEVRYVPSDSTVVWVRGRDGRFIECANRQLGMLESPHAEDALAALPDLEARMEQLYQRAERAGTPVPELTPVPALPAVDDDTEPTGEFDPLMLRAAGDDIEEYSYTFRKDTQK